MAFPDSVVDQAWAKAGGKCEHISIIIFERIRKWLILG